MSSTQRLALRIAVYTVVVLVLGAAVLGGVIIARAPAAKSPEILIQLGHVDDVTSMTWSPDGKTLASGSGDHTVKLWDAGSGQLLRTLSGHAGHVWSVAWNPDGKTLASGSADHTVKLWEPGSGQLLRTLSGHAYSVMSVAWSPDSKTLASGSYDHTVKLWDAGSGRLLRALSLHSTEVVSVAWSPDGKTLASGNMDNTVKLWEAGSGQLLRNLSGHADSVDAVAWSPDGKTLASGSYDHTVKLWEAGSGRLLRNLSGHTGPVLSVAWSPDRKTLASGSGDNTVKLWEAGSGQPLRTLAGHANIVTSVAWSPSKTLASGSYDHTVKLWEAGSGQLLRNLSGHAPSVRSVAWSPDGKMLASGGGGGMVELWEAGSGKMLRALGPDAGYVMSVTWSPDGKIMASGSGDHTVKLWDAGSGQLLRNLSGHADSVDAVAWSPDGKTLASGSYDDTVKLWEAGSGRLLRTLSGHAGHVWSVAWSPDRKTLASGSGDNTVKLWEAGSGQLLRNLSGHADSVDAVAWSPDGRILASGSGDHTVKLWEAQSGLLLRTLSGHAGGVTSVAWAPDGRTLASGSEDATIRQWPVRTEQSPVSSTLLPGDEWFCYRPGALLYQSSLQGDQSAAVRFDNRLRPVYPLTYYRKELQRKNLQAALLEPAPDIKPKPIRYAWDSFSNKPLWFGGFAFVYFTGVTVALVLAHRSDPAQVARQFFAKAGFENVDPIDSRMLRLRPGKDQGPAGGVIFQADEPMPAPPEISKTYIVYKSQSPPTEDILALRAKLNREVIPLQSTILATAVAENTCAQTLRDLEEPYVARTDPYDESRPITDPTWFFGRNDLLDRLPAVLRQGQHAGLFGLRKVGKTSLINQLRQRLASTPTAWIDCQGYAPVADDLFREIAAQLQKELAVHRIKKVASPKGSAPDPFRDQFLRLYEAWQKAGRHEPFVLILDEVDKLFPDRRVPNSGQILSEWVRLSRMLRALAQEKKCLSVLVTAYRPDVNRQNKLSESVGENPMFMSFQEYYLGSLDRADTEKMVS